MGKIKIMSILIIIVAISLISSSIEDVEAEKAAIQEVVIGGYVEPIFVSGDIEAIKKGFHPEFNMLILRENNLVKYPLEEWIKSIKKREYPSTGIVAYDILNYDITVKMKINIKKNRLKKLFKFIIHPFSNFP